MRIFGWAAKTLVVRIDFPALSDYTAFLREQADREARAEEQQKQIDALTEQVQQLTAGLHQSTSGLQKATEGAQ